MQELTFLWQDWMGSPLSVSQKRELPEIVKDITGFQDFASNKETNS
jgi:chemotaxis regulatin CheY-phosphate phosphatase CheZ